MTPTPFPRALDAPLGESVVLDARLIERAIAASRESPRRRAKTGPYDERLDKDFAPWAPAEGSPEASRYLEQLTG